MRGLLSYRTIRHTHASFKALRRCGCLNPSPLAEGLYLFHNLCPQRPHTSTPFTCLLPRTLTFTYHAECKCQWLVDTATWLSQGVSEVATLHALFNRGGGKEADSRPRPGVGRPKKLRVSGLGARRCPPLARIRWNLCIQSLPVL